ncbi:MAG: hypothetical protein RIR70_1821, partial [Pseudomonadota bacterium]
HEASVADLASSNLPTPPEPPPPAPAPRPLQLEDHRIASFERRVAAALNYQGFGNVRIAMPRPHHLEVRMTANAMRPLARAANRAALTILRASPLDLASIQVSFEDNSQPIARYEFFDLNKLDDFYSGLIDEAALAPFIKAQMISPEYAHIDPLTRFADIRRPADAPQLTDLLQPAARPLRRASDDFLEAGKAIRGIDWQSAALTGGGLLLTSRLLDRRADNFARDHADNRLLSGMTRVGNAYPLLATAGAAAHALFSTEPQAKRVSYAATEAAGAALIASSALKLAIKRERPDHSDKKSMPSNHAAVAWAVTTPYAVEYRAPWLYAAPLLTQFARVEDRKHWVSDTVAGSLLGYTLGRVFHDASRRDTALPRVFATRDEVGVSWAF